MIWIAQHAGMSKRTLYEGFPDKREIFTAVVIFRDSVPELPPVANYPNVIPVPSTSTR